MRVRGVGADLRVRPTWLLVDHDAELLGARFPPSADVENPMPGSVGALNDPSIFAGRARW